MRRFLIPLLALLSLSGKVFGAGASEVGLTPVMKWSNNFFPKELWIARVDETVELRYNNGNQDSPPIATYVGDARSSIHFRFREALRCGKMFRISSEGEGDDKPLIVSFVEVPVDLADYKFSPEDIEGLEIKTETYEDSPRWFGFARGEKHRRSCLT